MKPILLIAALLLALPAPAQHRVLAVGNNKLMVVERDGAVSWEMPWPGGTHDLHVLPNGHYLAVRMAKVVVEIDPATKADVWRYDAAASNGNAGKRIEIHAIQPLPGSAIMIAESGPGRIIEIDRDGKLLKEIALRADHPDPHRDTRLARKLDNGHYLVAHEGDGVIREYKADGAVVWEYPVPLFGRQRAEGHGPEAFGNQTFSALRLPNGNTLIGTGNGHSLLEVNPAK